MALPYEMRNDAAIVCMSIVLVGIGPTSLLSRI